MSVRRFPIAAAFLIAGLSGCSSADGALDGEYAGGGTFGNGFENIDAGYDSQDAGASDAEDSGSAAAVQLRVLQGVLNLRASYLCYAPDFDPEDADAGLEQALELPLSSADGGGLGLGVVTGYASVPSMTSGAITVHRAPILLDAGIADAATSEAGPLADGSVDATLDGGANDAGLAPTPRCDRASLEAVLPLPMPAAWVDPPRDELDAGAVADGGPALEAGPSIEERGFVSTASGSEPLTLFGSGLLIDRTELERRVDAERERYTREHPGDAKLALEAAAGYRRALEAAYGPRFLLSRAQPPARARSFSLHFSHLIPDVPGTQAKTDSVSGALHLCITVGSLEGSELADAGAAGFDFRNYAALGDDLDPSLPYRFRVFVHSEYVKEQKTCATTSLKPVAELMVNAGRFEAGRSYSLVAWGALSSEAICTSPEALIRPGCAQSVDTLRARLQLIDN